MDSDITASAEWAALVGHHSDIASRHLRDLFANDPDRAKRMSVQAGDLYLDYSKHRATDETLRLLVALARKAGLRERIDAMFAGRHVNVSEDRPALHVALRLPAGATLRVDGEDVVGEVHGVLDTMGKLAEQVRSGAWRGHTGRRMRNIVNIGIGGSDLGPAMAYQALLKMNVVSHNELAVEAITAMSITHPYCGATYDTHVAKGFVLCESAESGVSMVISGIETPYIARTARRPTIPAIPGQIFGFLDSSEE